MPSLNIVARTRKITSDAQCLLYWLVQRLGCHNFSMVKVSRAHNPSSFSVDADKYTCNHCDAKTDLSINFVRVHAIQLGKSPSTPGHGSFAAVFVVSAKDLFFSRVYDSEDKFCALGYRDNTQKWMWCLRRPSSSGLAVQCCQYAIIFCALSQVTKHTEVALIQSTEHLSGKCLECLCNIVLQQITLVPASLHWLETPEVHRVWGCLFLVDFACVCAEERSRFLRFVTGRRRLPAPLWICLGRR